MYKALFLFIILIFPLTAFGAEDDPILLGAIFAKTGPAAKTSVYHYEMVRFAVNELNSSGGLLGRPIKLLEYDTQSKPLSAYSIAQQAITDGVCCVVGPSWSSQAFAMAKVFQKAKLPMIATSATADAITRTGDYIFRSGYVDSFQARIVTEFALKDLQAKTAVTITNPSSPYSAGLSKVFTEVFQNSGGEILYAGEYLTDAADFSSELTKIAELSPDVVFFPGHSRDSSLILKQAAAMNVERTFLGGDGWSSLQRFPNFGLSIHGPHYFVTHWDKESDIPESRTMLERYTEKYGRSRAATLNGANVLSYDAVGLFADAVRRAGNTSPQDIRDALASTKNFRGATGTISYNEYGDPIKPAVIIAVGGQQEHTQYIRTVFPDELK